MASFERSKFDALPRDFRKKYLTYGELTSHVRAWAEAFPQWVRLGSLGKTPEGRELWFLTLGPEPERVRPSVWIDGNMHASELCGSSVALAIAEDVLRLHVEAKEGLHGLPASVVQRLREVRFFVLPRMCPDGAEAVLSDGRYVRSNPREREPRGTKPRWVCKDMDGDGLALLMRKKDEAGEFVESSAFPGLMVPRTLDDEGPAYKIYPEGIIEPYDGFTIPDPYFLSDNDTDLNRNFPWSWRPEPDQTGAGAYPASEPESRAVVEFAVQHPEIFAWLNLHTFGGVFIRPLGHAPDAKLDPGDLALFRQVAAWAETHTGYPMVSGFDEFLYEPEKPLHGDLSDFAFHQRGAISYVVELWDLFHELGIPRRKPFVSHYTHLSREEMVKLAQWDREKNGARIFRPWKPWVHPQLGAVEVGGLDIRVGITNPPYERIDGVAQGQSAAFLRVAAMAPALRLDVVGKETLGPDLHRIDLKVRNEGYLATPILASAAKLPLQVPLVARARVADAGGSGSLISSLDAYKEVGHLDGWGRGLYDEGSSLFFQRSRGNGAERLLTYTVKGKGTLEVRVGSPRSGWVEASVPFGV